MDNDIIRQPPEAASFGSLVISIAAAALTYMGHAVVPGTDKTEVSLPIAKQSIDTLDMLRAKTEGNRTPEESKMIEELLYELRLAYVQAESAKPLIIS
jgi:hypothetical protein